MLEHFPSYAPAAHPRRSINTNLSTSFAGCAFAGLVIAAIVWLFGVVL